MPVILIGGNPPGTPPESAGVALGAWWDFTDRNTLFTDVGRTAIAVDGNTVKGVTDKSGNGYHLSEATNGPTLRTAPAPNIGGLPCLEFDGVNDVLTTASTRDRFGGSSSGAYTVFAIALHDTALGAEGGGWNPAATILRNSLYILGGSNFAGQVYINHDTSSAARALARKAAAEDAWHIVTASASGNGVANPNFAATASIGVDDTRTASLVSVTSAVGNFASSVAALIVGAGTWNGYIAEIAYYFSALTEAQRKDVETYLAYKYGITILY